MRQPELERLEQALRHSCLGRNLLKALAAPRAAGVEAGLELLAEALESEVRLRITVPVHADDPDLMDAARQLRLVPARGACDPTVAIMGLIDEWSARAAGENGEWREGDRFIPRLRSARGPRGARFCPWLKMNFPLLYRDAERIAAFVTSSARP